MKKQIIKEIELPSGITASLIKNTLKINGPKGEIERTLPKGIEIKADGIITIEHTKATKNEKKIIYSFVAHIKNMLKGVQELFTYKMKICNIHFPMTVSFQNNELIIKNFLGEVRERKAPIPEGVQVKIDKENIYISSLDKEKAGQAAANIERATWIRLRDRRVFQDGIFIIEKPGEETI